MSKHKPIPKKVRELVYRKLDGHCAYCGCKIAYKDMQVDHVKSVYLNVEYRQDSTLDEINSIGNLLPSCRQCNFYKSSWELEGFRNNIRTSLIDNLRKNFNYRLLVKYGIIKEQVPDDVKFYFEKVKEQEDERKDE